MSFDSREGSGYGILKSSCCNTLEDAAIEEIRRNGFTVLGSVFSAEQMQKASELIDQLYDQQKKEYARHGKLSDVHDEDMVRCPLAYDDCFVELCSNPFLHRVISGILGEHYVLLQQNAILNKSKTENHQSGWHRDIPHQHWVNSRPLALACLIAVDDFTQEGGATWVLPASQHQEDFPSGTFVSKHGVCVEAPVGSIIIMDAMLYHRSGDNTRPNFVRRAVNNLIGMPFLSQQIDIPAMLNKRGIVLNESPFLSKFLGYRWNTAPDVETWRKRHNNKG